MVFIMNLKTEKYNTFYIKIPEEKQKAMKLCLTSLRFDIKILHLKQ